MSKLIPRKLFPLLLATAALTLSACQQAAGTGEARVAPAPLVEAIDPQRDPIKATQARKQLMERPEQVADVAALRREVLALIADKSADNVQQCLVLPLGHKPCGGPAEYVAVSTKGKDQAALLKKLEAYNQAAEAENLRLGRMSDCAVVPKPQVQLVNGQCTLVNEVTY
ncbi:MAG: hypothetical protein PHE38_13360 [Alishewanella agri]|nr:hypothetical protein [Alishewanella agri]